MVQWLASLPLDQLSRVQFSAQGLPTSPLIFLIVKYAKLTEVSPLKKRGYRINGSCAQLCIFYNIFYHFHQMFCATLANKIINKIIKSVFKLEIQILIKNHPSLPPPTPQQQK